MMRRALLVTSVVAFVHTGAALLMAGPFRSKSAQAPPVVDQRYLNPLGAALSADGLRAYVALSGVDEVAEVDLVSGRTLTRVPTGKRPRDVRRDGAVLTVTDDGPGVLLISLLTGQSQRVEQAPSGAERVAPAVTVEIPAKSKTDGPDRISLTVRHEPAWNATTGHAVTEAVFRNNVSAMFMSGSGIQGRGPSGALGFAGGNSQVGWGAGVIGGDSLTMSLDRATRKAAQPADVVWNRPFKIVFVAAAGSDTVLGLNPSGFRERLQAVSRTSAFGGPPAGLGWGVLGGPGSTVAHPPAHLIRYRLPTQSNPRRLAVSEDGRTLVASNTLSDSLTVIAVGPAGARVVKHVPLGGPTPDAARRGEVLFHSARLSFNGRFACSSCHPGGGGDDHVWLTPTEDPGFARRTKPLFGVRDTAPYGWRGDSPTLADRVRKTLTKLHKNPLRRDEVRDLVAFLESLDPPAAVADDAAGTAERGRELFEGRARCSKCHAGDRLTDGKLHDVGTGGQFDTPSLRGVGRRRGLLHTGQANEPADIFRHHNKDLRHGAAHELDPWEFGDLMAYLKSL
jgi:cytochrome c peroxidase